VVSITAVVPTKPADQPPIVLVHGAANSALVWTCWQEALAAAGWESHAVDLRGHGKSAPADLSGTSMRDYADDVMEAARQLGRPPVLIGWSMGGLVAIMAAARIDAVACIGLAPSFPKRTTDASVPLRAREFGPEEYGITSRDIDDQPAMPDLDRDERRIALDSLGSESRRARDERKAGIVIESLRCPLLIVTGGNDRQFPPEKYDDFPLDAERVCVDGASHWGLVLSRRALAEAVPAVLGWLAANPTG
jgi:pimeloyl-ACP methyl ester carboxylesterase